MRAEDIPDFLSLLSAIARLRFPVRSAGVLKEQLPRGRASMRLGATRVDLHAIIDTLPAHYFPLRNIQDLASKAASFVDANAGQLTRLSGSSAAMRNTGSASRSGKFVGRIRSGPIINKTRHALGDVVPSSGRMGTAPAGYHPAPVERPESAMKRGSASSYRSRAVAPLTKG